MKRFAMPLAVGAILVVGWWFFIRGDTDEDAARANADLLFNRAWIAAPESEPKKTDFVHAMMVVDSVPIGVFQKASQFRVEIERFNYTAESTELLVHFPQSDQKAKIGYRIEPCHERPPFDLCLTLKKNPWGGPKRYFGQRESGKATAAYQSLSRSLGAQITRSQ